MNTDNRYAPIDGCDCTICEWVRASKPYRDPDPDLEANYQKYLAGELVSRDSRE